MKPNRFLILTGALAAHISTADAAPDILPGLWESKVDFSSESGQFEQAMAQAEAMIASMPEEQQQMMREMMASQGVSLGLGDRTVQTCLTEADIQNFDLAQTEEGCTQNVEETADNHFRMTLQCEDASMSGEGEFVVKDNKSYTGTIVMQLNMDGQPDTVTMTQEGRWLSADCGAIQPD